MQWDYKVLKYSAGGFLGGKVQAEALEKDLARLEADIKTLEDEQS